MFLIDIRVLSRYTECCANRIGIAIGPRTWFGTKFGNNVSRSGFVHDNQFAGAFGYGIAISSAENFTVQGNNFFGNSSFIGARGPNCSESDFVPSPAAFITEANTTTSMSISSNFVDIGQGDSLTCLIPPNGGDFWPFGPNPSNSTSTPGTSGGSAHSGAIVVVGIILALLLCGLATWLVRKYILRKKARRQLNKIH